MSRRFESPHAVMQHALALAQQGVGRVEPNPPVGAVVVDGDLRLLGEGYHQQFGGPHAEVHALQAAGEAARGQSLYVTLEPCNHSGKTPPCTEAIIEAGLRSVVVATVDPARHTDGAGLARLREAGIDVEVGLCEYEAQKLIAPFTKLHTTGRPFVHAKWAMSLDGRIATRLGDSKWISGEGSRQIVHQLRGRMDAVLVGIGTALADNPLLTTRPRGPRTATRVIVDSRARLPVDSQLVRTCEEAPLLVIAGPQADAERIAALRGAGVEVLVLAEEHAGRPSLSTVMNELGSRQMTNVLVEGGASVLGSLFDHRLVDMVHVFVGPYVIGGEHAWPAVAGLGCEALSDAFRLVDPEMRQVGRDVYLFGRLGG
jgi:diaminohydroxyphosphoribosylaminopyrimidine deaminase / 5-amino-6-(5-phosphoribosylamino)uracil reductase